MVAKDRAHQADDLLINTSYRVHYNLAEAEVFDKVKETVIYVGCGKDMSSLFLFENATFYIHQDLTDRHLPKALQILSNNKVITDFVEIEDTPVRGESEFSYKGKRKKLIEIHGDMSDPLQNSVSDENETYFNQGNIAFVVPQEATSNLEAIYFFGMPYPDSIRALQINLLPHLVLGGVFHGAYPYKGGRFEGNVPNKLGLEQHDGVFIKREQLSSKEIEEVIGFSIKAYASLIQRRQMYQQRKRDGFLFETDGLQGIIE